MLCNNENMHELHKNFLKAFLIYTKVKISKTCKDEFIFLYYADKQNK